MAIRLKPNEFVDEVHKRLQAQEYTLSRPQVNAVMKAMAEEAADCIRLGFQVIVPNFVKIEPRYVPPKEARTGVNPITKEVQDFAPKPAKFIVKVLKMPGLTKSFPDAESEEGKALIETLGS